MSTKGVDSRSADSIELHEMILRPADPISNYNDTRKESKRNSYNSVWKEASENEPLTGRNFAEHEGKPNGYLILLKRLNNKIRSVSTHELMTFFIFRWFSKFKQMLRWRETNSAILCIWCSVSVTGRLQRSIFNYRVAH